MYVSTAMHYEIFEQKGLYGPLLGYEPFCSSVMLLAVCLLHEVCRYMSDSPCGGSNRECMLRHACLNS